MPAPTKLYIDSDGVERGYYVYLHKERATGEVFYVGKGHGRRAWESTSRNEAWKARIEFLAGTRDVAIARDNLSEIEALELEEIESLAGVWDVVIVKDNLSEIEAFELEADLVEERGGASWTGGKLTNMVPGGGFSVSLGVQLDSKGWSAAYFAARRFRPFTRQKQGAFANLVKEKLEPLDRQLAGLDNEGSDNDDPRFESASTAECVVRSLLKTLSDFLRRRASWKDFGIALEEACDGLEFDCENTAEHHPRVLPLLKATFSLTHGFFVCIDSSNKAKAEKHANVIVRRLQSSLKHFLHAIADAQKLLADCDRLRDATSAKLMGKCQHRFRDAKGRYTRPDRRKVFRMEIDGERTLCQWWTERQLEDALAIPVEAERLPDAPFTWKRLLFSTLAVQHAGLSDASFTWMHLQRLAIPVEAERLPEVVPGESVTDEYEIADIARLKQQMQKLLATLREQVVKRLAKMQEQIGTK